MVERKQLVTALWQQLSNEEAAWLNAALDEIAAARSSDEKSTELYLRYSAMARRKLCCTVLEQVGRWLTDEVGRLLLLMQWLDHYSSQEQVDKLKSIYRMVDENEKQVIAKGFALLDKEGAAVDLATSIGRTNNINLFAAIALNNPYPSAFYDERAFNQLVLKALFMGLDISAMQGLQQHLSPTLSLLCIDLVKENLAAVRSPACSIWLGIRFADLCNEDQQLYLSFINNKETLHRYYSILSLQASNYSSGQNVFVMSLQAALKNEKENKIKEILIAILKDFSLQQQQLI